MSKKKKKKAESSDEVKAVVVNRSPGFSSRFKEDLAWWFKQNFLVASKILDLVTAVMENPFEGIVFWGFIFPQPNPQTSTTTDNNSDKK